MNILFYLKQILTFLLNSLGKKHHVVLFHMTVSTVLRWNAGS